MESGVTSHGRCQRTHTSGKGRSSKAPPSPNYVPGPEEPEQAPLSPDYVPGPEHADDEIVAVGISQMRGCLHQYHEEDPVELSADGGITEMMRMSHQRRIGCDVDMVGLMRMREEEEHPCSCRLDSCCFTSCDQGPSMEGDRARLCQTSRYIHSTIVTTLPMASPPPLSQLPSPPLPIPSPSLPLSPPSPVLSPAPPPSPIRSLGYRAAMIRMRAEAASTSHSLPLPPPFILSPTRSDAPSSGIPPPLPISVPTSSPPLLLPSASRREDRPEVTLPPRKRLGIALGPRYEVGESSSAAAARPAGGLRADYDFVATMDREIRRDPEREVGYGITDSWDEIVETLQGAPVSTDTELGRHMTAFETRVRQDTDEIYTRLDDEQSQRQLLAGRLNMLFRDRRAHVMSLRTTVLGQMSEIRELHAADRRRQAVTSEMLKVDHRRSAEMRELRTADRTRQQQLIQTLTVMQSLQGQVTTLQGQVTALQGQVTALQGQQGPVGGPAQPELPEEAGSSS
ncbi:hypothetical protein Tco_1516620 [Tanacetum coccineum]